MDEQETLPYRTSGEDLQRFVSARARGRTMQQIRSLFTSDPSFQGTASAAEVLNLYDPTAEKLTPLGQELANAEKDESQDALLSAVLGYEPYELLLEAIFASGISHEEEKEYTPLKWVESWWEDNGYGSSQTNRDEGSTAFANVVSSVNLGEYKQGRHGHPSRIEWAPDAEKQVDEARRHLQGKEERESKKEVVEDDETSLEEENDSVEKRQKVELESPPENNSLTLNLSDGRVAKLSLPPRLSSAEKERLVSLVELMVATKGQQELPQMEMDL